MSFYSRKYRALPEPLGGGLDLFAQIFDLLCFTESKSLVRIVGVKVSLLVANSSVNCNGGDVWGEYEYDRDTSVFQSSHPEGTPEGSAKGGNQEVGQWGQGFQSISR